MRFPYMAMSDNIIRPDILHNGTTSGYSTLYNEIYWSFSNFEPTNNDNIVVAFLSPEVWQEIKSMRSGIQSNPQDADAWLKLIDAYIEIGGWGGCKNPENYMYFDKVYMTYEQAIQENPNSADLNASYADWLVNQLCLGNPSSSELETILSYLNKALALDPNDQTAQGDLSSIENMVPDLTFTPPPTIPPTLTLTPSITLIPSVTPTPTISLTPTNTPIPTSPLLPTQTPPPPITYALPSSKTPTPSPTPLPTPTLISAISAVFGGKSKGSGWLALSAFVLLLGAALITWLSVRIKRE